VERSHDEFHKRVLAEALSEQFGLALLAGEADEAERAVREGLDAQFGEADVYDLVVKPAMHRIGQLWRAGEISVAHEHLATQITTRVLVLVHELAGMPEARAGQRAMLAAVEGELHVMALDMAAKLLESAGYEVLFLGPDVPTHALPAVVEDYAPDLFLLTASMAEAGERLPQAVEAIAAAGTGDIGVIAGGAGVRGNLMSGPRLTVEPTVSRVVEAADSLTRRADLN